MAVDLVPASSQAATVPSAAVNLNTGTFVCWIAPDFDPSGTTNHYVFDTDTARHAFYKVNLTNKMSMYNDGRESLFDVTGLWSSGSFTHLAFAYDKSGPTQSLYVNGSSTSTTSSSGTWGSSALGTSLHVGQRFSSSEFFDGDISEVATFNVVLTSGEIAALAKGASPLLIRRGLLGYWPIIRNGVPSFGSNALTLAGSPSVSPHPRVIYPRRRQAFSVAAAAAPVAAGGRVLVASAPRRRWSF